MTEATDVTSTAPSLASDFNIKKILDLLPHRCPMLLVDRVISLEPRKSIAAIENVTFNEPFFNGHFPGHSVMPGVLILEVLTQTAVLLTFGGADHGRRENQLCLFVNIDDARFKRQVTLGDQLVMTTELLCSRSGVQEFKVYGKVDNEVVVEAEIMCTMCEDESKGEA